MAGWAAVWDSKPSEDVKDLRRIWLNTDLRDKIRWTQVRPPPPPYGERVCVLLTLLSRGLWTLHGAFAALQSNAKLLI